MVFDLRKLQANPQPTPVAAPAVAPPPPAVLINRPPSQRPVVAPAEALTVTTIEGSAAAHALVEFVDVAEDEDGIDAVEDRAHAAALVEVATPPKAGGLLNGSSPSSCATDTPAPRARRGRPRKSGVATTATAGADTATVSAVSAPDPKAPAPTTTAPGCASSVGDLAVAVNALFSAIRSLETTGTTGRYLQDAEEAMQRFGGVL